MSNSNEPSLGALPPFGADKAKPSVPSTTSNGGLHLGSISREIGTGEHAKDSFIWMTLRYCFYIGTGFSAVILVAYIYFAIFKDEPDKVDVISALKDVWSIFTPILTLALGYAFGKRDRGE